MNSDNNAFSGFHIPASNNPQQNQPNTSAPVGGQQNSVPSTSGDGEMKPPTFSGGIQFGRQPQSNPPAAQPVSPTPPPIAQPDSPPPPKLQASPALDSARESTPEMSTTQELPNAVANSSAERVSESPLSAPPGLHISRQQSADSAPVAAEEKSENQTEAVAVPSANLQDDSDSPNIADLPDIPSFDGGEIEQLTDGASEEAAAAMVLIFDYTRGNFGSDLHLCGDSIPRMRLFGEIEPMPNGRVLTEMEIYQMIRSTMTQETWEQFIETSDVDYSFVDVKGRRYRCNAMQTLGGPVAVFRIIADKIMSFSELHLPKSVEKIAECKKGLVLVTGATGCGKSTTLATLVDILNQNDPGHILTVEDPVEILHHSKKSLVNHREVKTHTKSFARALKSALREDPDCIMIGEMRDLETISLALTAAETGHLVFGTLHTSSAPKTITRIIDVFPSGEQPQIRAMLAESIQCVISQVLCKRRDGKGRVAAFEVMFGTPGIRNLIRMDKIYQIPSAISTGMHDGMQTLDQALEKLVKEGIIDLEEAKLQARHPEELKA